MPDPVLDTIHFFPSQLRESWKAVSALETAIDFSKILNVVICGMGGSALGGRIVHSLGADSLHIPVEVVSGYKVPFYVGEQTLVILSSYSGGTEETISAFHEAYEKRGQLFVITTGGLLSDLAHEHQIPTYIINPEFNPSNQPRLALGYAVGSLLALFAKAKFMVVLPEEFEMAVHKAEGYSSEFDVEMNEENNEAKQMAQKLGEKIPILVSSEHLLGATHAFKNQLNETAKTFSALFDLPELNHHLLEGLKFPKALNDQIQFVFLESELYSDRVKRRYSITKDVLDKQHIEHTTYKVRSMDKLSQALEVLTFGSFVQYYLALKNNVKMMEIPWVDYFKEQMGKE